VACEPNHRTNSSAGIVGATRKDGHQPGLSRISARAQFEGDTAWFARLQGSKPPTDALVLVPWNHEPTFNIGIDLGASDLCVLDFDDPSGIPAWVDEIRTYKVKTARGVHVYFRDARPTTGLFIDGTKVGDVKSIGGYVLGEGSVHPDGSIYTVIDGSAIIPLPDISSLVKRDKERVNASGDGERIPHGSHDTELTRIAGVLRNAGFSADKIEEHLIEVCENRCEGYGTDYRQMCHKIAHSIGKKPVGHADPIAIVGSSQVRSTCPREGEVSPSDGRPSRGNQGRPHERTRHRSTHPAKPVHAWRS
jgi:hypothetical protein